MARGSSIRLRCGEREIKCTLDAKDRIRRNDRPLAIPAERTDRLVNQESAAPTLFYSVIFDRCGRAAIT